MKNIAFGLILAVSIGAVLYFISSGIPLAVVAGPSPADPVFRTSDGYEFSYDSSWVPYQISDQSPRVTRFYSNTREQSLSGEEDPGDLELTIYDNPHNLSLEDFFNGTDRPDIFEEASNQFRPFIVNGIPGIWIDNGLGFYKYSAFVTAVDGKVYEFIDSGERHQKDGAFLKSVKSLKKSSSQAIALADTSFRYPVDGTWSVSNDFWDCAVQCYHLAEDSGRPATTPVYAPSDGTVKHTAERTLYGHVIIIEHNLGSETVTSVIGHLSPDVKVSVGDQVSKGQLIGYLGDRSNNGGWPPHSHYGVNKGGYAGDTAHGCDGGWVYEGYTSDTCVKSDWYDPTDFNNSHASDSSPLSKPALSSPSNGATLSSRAVPFNWYGVTETGSNGPFNYSLQVRDSSGATMYNGPWTDDLYSYSVTLPKDDVFTWFVKAGDHNGHQTISDTWSFTVQTRFRAQLISQNANPQIGHGQSYKFSVTLKNIGTYAWNRAGLSPTPVNLATSRDRNRVSSFIREDVPGGNPSGWISPNRITMLDDTVTPGNTTSFEFWYTVPDSLAVGTYPESFELVADNAYLGWFGNPIITWNITVIPDYNAALSRQDYTCATVRSLSKGGSLQFSVKMKNTGSKTWYRDGSTPTHLGTNQPHDRVPDFTRNDVLTNNPSGWYASNRIYMVESSVPQNSIGTFTFWMSMPVSHSTGPRTEHFQVVVDNVANGWIGPDIGWCMNLYGAPGDYHTQFVSQNAYPTLHWGQWYTFTITFKNTGLAIWHPSVVRLGTDRPADRVPIFSKGNGWSSNNRVNLPVLAVPPGATVTFSFDMGVPSTVANGNYNEYFRPVADGVTWLEDYGCYWTIYVRN